MTKEYVHIKMGKDTKLYPHGETNKIYPSKRIVVEVDGRTVIAFQNRDLTTDKPREVIVPGYIINYQTRTEHGLKVSDIELITDSAERAAVEKEIFRKELEGFINFWT